MMKHWITLLGALAFLAFVSPLAAQEAVTADSLEAVAEDAADQAETAADTAEDAADQAETAAETAEDAADQVEAIADAAEEAPDWVFDLKSTDNAPEAKGTVSVIEGETENTFVVEVDGVPVVDNLDAEGRDVNAYTVWIVPSKDKVPESVLAGVLTVSPEGDGEFEGATALDTFGIIVTATADGAPAQISGVPVLTGIPATAPVETPVEETPAEAETPTPADTPAAGETPDAEQAPTPEPTPEAAPPAPAAEE